MPTKPTRAGSTPALPAWLKRLKVPTICQAGAFAVGLLLEPHIAQAADRATSSSVISLDGCQWLIAFDERNVGRIQRWFVGPPTNATPTKIPSIAQDAFPGKHGVFWLWRDFETPRNPHRNGRYLLRFWGVDYLAEAWVNGLPIGRHEGAEEPFVLDISSAISPNGANRLAVRVLNPTYEAIEGIALAETPHRNKTYPYSPGADFNYGGITDSVELCVVPRLRLTDLYARPDPETGRVRVEARVCNDGRRSLSARVDGGLSPANGGLTLDTTTARRRFPPGESTVNLDLGVGQPRLWQLNDPFLYRITVRVREDQTDSFDEQSVRCGFRDFRFKSGYFRLNGQRIFLKSSHSGTDIPIGVRVPGDPDLLRRDLLNSKAMGFNMIRFIAGMGRRDQLDLCDEIGLLVYEENFASWGMAPSRRVAEHLEAATQAMVRRDRNHPSVVIWGLLNETPTGPLFYHAVETLPRLRAWDDSRVVLLNSGAWDDFTGDKGILPARWREARNFIPNVTCNTANSNLTFAGATWPPGQLALHPGPKGEYSVVRWSARQAGEYSVTAVFSNLVPSRLTPIRVGLLHNAHPAAGGTVRRNLHSDHVGFSGTLVCHTGDTIDAVVGADDGSALNLPVMLDLVIETSAGARSHATGDFGWRTNPHGPWRYGWLAPGHQPDPRSFRPYAVGEAPGPAVIGHLCNPGSTAWEDLISDRHLYPELPHDAGVVRTLRAANGHGRPVWLSEYGIGSGLDLVRLTRHYEQQRKTDGADAATYRRFLAAFLADWERWALSDTFASPEDYFRQCLAWMADLRRLGVNAIRANPNVVGYSLTGTHDQGLTGEGLTTTFRELKPGTVDAMFDAFYPLRWCLFAEPAHVYRGGRVRLEAVLANEDILGPGDYPVRFQLVGPTNERIYDKTVTVHVPQRALGREPSFALPALSEEVTANGPSGRYRFLADFQQGGAAAGGEITLQVTDAADLPPVPFEVWLWGDDSLLADWLGAHGVKCRPFADGDSRKRAVVLVGSKRAGGAGAFADLVRSIARGSSAVFLSPEVFREGDNLTAWLPLVQKGSLARLPSWVYHKDDWAKKHPIFDGLPSGSLLDHTYYRELITPLAWSGQEAPREVVAGSINTSCWYSSGLLVAVHQVGAGRFIINTLKIRENLGKHPAAERLLRNMLRYAGQDMDQPPTDLPADFDRQLQAMGYK